MKDEKTCNESTKPITITFDSLPAAMINNIGSFLLFSDIINFEKTSNICFSSLRNPYPGLKEFGYRHEEESIPFNEYIKKPTNNYIQFQCVESLSLHAFQIPPADYKIFNQSERLWDPPGRFSCLKTVVKESFPN